MLEIVAAVSTRPGLRRLPPLVFLRLRRGGRDLAARAERTAVGWAGFGRFRCAIGLPTWTVNRPCGPAPYPRRGHPARGAHARARLHATRTAATRLCRNSERADAHVLLERWWGSWRTEAEWTLDGTAHAEVGTR